MSSNKNYESMRWEIIIDANQRREGKKNSVNNRIEIIFFHFISSHNGEITCFFPERSGGKKSGVLFC